MSEAIGSGFDVVVVGTGPGGASVARELAVRGRRVLMLEAGADRPMGDSLVRQLPVMRFSFPSWGTSLLRAVTTGGTSTLYCACAFEPPLEMFRSYGIDLSAEIAEIRAELPVGPLPDRAIGPRARRILRSARELGYAWPQLEKFVYADRCGTGVPYDAKWNARAWVEEARRHGAVLETGARVKRILLAGGAASGVEFRQRGTTRRAEAGAVVLSAGGVGTARILRATGIKRAGEGFFCDPAVVVHGSVHDLDAGPEHPMVAGVKLHDDGYMLTDHTLHPYQFRSLALLALRPDRCFAFRHTLGVMVKVEDEIGGRIGDRGRVRRVFSPSDRDRLRRGCERAEKILRHAGADRLFRTWIVATHPGGTARVNDVVNADLRTDYDNLYVCDCSVIPEPWGLPPTFALLALGRRLAKHLAPAH